MRPLPSRLPGPGHREATEPSPNCPCPEKNNHDFFFRSNEDLSHDSGMKLTSLKKAKAELLKSDLVQSWQMHWIDKETKKKSEKKVTAYRILK